MLDGFCNANPRICFGNRYFCFVFERFCNAVGLAESMHEVASDGADRSSDE